ncbi:hypothetical protein ANN_27003 [Periplaneta americana]|uniref:Mariner Mos1 transposase n=1 Tax=Periplaneta americana TaxID=6978 RepID=A0ABQ8RWW6_PERAM|nr:hypothetical protein ANN_27003 [Periplaneta americana]
MLTLFWDEQGIILKHYIPKGNTITSALLKNHLLPAIKSKGRLQHDNAHPHIACVTVTTINDLHFETLPYPAYSPDLALSDYHLFGPLKEAMGGKIFHSDEEVHTRPEDFFQRNFYALEDLC